MSAGCVFDAAHKKTRRKRYDAYGELASPARFERAAFRLGGGCSILLSYGDRVDRQGPLYPFPARVSIRKNRKAPPLPFSYWMTRTRMTLGRWVTSLITA